MNDWLPFSTWPRRNVHERLPNKRAASELLATLDPVIESGAAMMTSAYLMTIALSSLFFMLGWLTYRYVPGVGRNGFFGIRTPWALESNDNWTYANRHGGLAIMAGALCMAFLSVLILPFVSAGVAGLAVTTIMVSCVSLAVLWTLNRCRPRNPKR